MRVTRPSLQTGGAFALYLLASVLLFARPVLAHMGSECLCIPTTTDEGIVAWGLAWWPHALIHGLNPFYPRLIYAPQGIDIAHGTLMPALAIAMWPVTALTSPLASFNVAATLAPALAATTAFHLCRTLTHRFWPALVGGWLFGFSTYMLGQETAHLNLTLVFLVPVIVEVCLTAAPLGRRTTRRTTAWLAVLLALQLLLSLEIFASAVVFGAVALLAGWLLVPGERRAAVAGVARGAVAGLVVACVVCSPYLYYATAPGGAPVSTAKTTKSSADLLALVIPNQLTRIGGIHFLHTTERFSAGYVEGAVYLGVPLLALVAVALWRARSAWWARVAAVTLAVVLICALGERLQIDGHKTIPLPWDLLGRLPLLGQALPVRFVMYAALICAVVAALALAGASAGRWRWLAWGLAAVAIASLWPDTSYTFWNSNPQVPRLFTTGAYRRVLDVSRGNVLVLPVGSYGESMLWNAQTRLGFTMASGYVVPPGAPDPYGASAIYPTLLYDAVPATGVEADARAFIAAHDVVSAVMSITFAKASPWPRILSGIGWHGAVVDGAVVFRP